MKDFKTLLFISANILITKPTLQYDETNLRLTADRLFMCVFLTRLFVFCVRTKQRESTEHGGGRTVGRSGR